MALSDSYIQVYGQLGDFFRRIADGQAPEKFTRQYVKDLGFASSNFNAVIPLLKSLGFLSPDGTPTSRYHEYRNSARSRRVMAEALREAYGDLFTIKASPTDADRPLIEGKFKSVHNASPVTARLMASTFYSLLDLADMSSPSTAETKTAEEKPPESQPKSLADTISKTPTRPAPTLHYNIQIHLPGNASEETYVSIFNALRKTFQ